MLGVKLHGLVRYDPVLFTTEYLEKYGQPSQVGRALEQALQTGNEPLLAGLQGSRWPHQFPTSDTISFVKLWEHRGRYATYLYVDWHSYERYEYHLEQVQGRWVVAPEDLRYLLYSGQWRAFFPPHVPPLKPKKLSHGTWYPGSCPIPQASHPPTPGFAHPEFPTRESPDPKLPLLAFLPPLCYNSGVGAQERP